MLKLKMLLKFMVRVKDFASGGGEKNNRVKVSTK